MSALGRLLVRTHDVGFCSTGKSAAKMKLHMKLCTIRHVMLRNFTLLGSLRPCYSSCYLGADLVIIPRQPVEMTRIKMQKTLRVGNVERLSHSPATRGSVERRKVPSGVHGGPPAANAFW